MFFKLFSIMLILFLFIVIFASAIVPKNELTLLFMDIISVFDENGKQKDFALSSWYCKPAILKCLAYRLKKDFPSLLFISCTKYGCRQFLPVFIKSFPVHNLDWIGYKDNLDWCVIEFNDNAK